MLDDCALPDFTTLTNNIKLLCTQHLLMQLQQASMGKNRITAINRSAQLTQKVFSTRYLTINPSSSMVMQIQHVECAESTS